MIAQFIECWQQAGGEAKSFPSLDGLRTFIVDTATEMKARAFIRHRHPLLDELKLEEELGIRLDSMGRAAAGRDEKQGQCCRYRSDRGRLCGQRDRYDRDDVQCGQGPFGQPAPADADRDRSRFVHSVQSRGSDVPNQCHRHGTYACWYPFHFRAEPFR